MNQDIKRIMELAGLSADPESRAIDRAVDRTRPAQADPEVYRDQARREAGDEVSPDFDRKFDAKMAEVDESAPPGMESMVRKLKKEYPGHEEKSFATAWSIYNKKHGKSKVDEAGPRINPAKVRSISEMPVEQAREEALAIVDRSKTDPAKKASLVSGINAAGSAMRVAKILYDMILSGEGNRVIKPRKVYENGSPVLSSDQAIDQHIVDIINNADQAYMSREEAMGRVTEFLADMGYSTDRVNDIIDRVSAYVGGEGEIEGDFSGDDVDFDQMGSSEGERFGQGQLSGFEPEVDDEYLEEYGEGSLGDQSCDLDQADYFPSGEHGPVTGTTGSSGARQGDNPLQKSTRVSGDEVMEGLKRRFKALVEELAGEPVGSGSAGSSVIGVKIDYLDIVDYEPNFSRIDLDGSIDVTARAVTGETVELGILVTMSAYGGYTADSEGVWYKLERLEMTDETGSPGIDDSEVYVTGQDTLGLTPEGKSEADPDRIRQAFGQNFFKDVISYVDSLRDDGIFNFITHLVDDKLGEAMMNSHEEDMRNDDDYRPARMRQYYPHRLS